jgi:galactokinase
MKVQEWIQALQGNALDEKFRYLYGNSETVLSQQKQRYLEAIAAFAERFPNRDEVHVFSAPGRTEVGGNHTDHQHGCVLAAAVNLDVIAVVAFHTEGMIRLKSKGYPQDDVALSDLQVHASETGKSAAIIRGVAEAFTKRGVQIGGFDAYTTSDVLSGSGLSSSAAFEILLGTILDQHYNGGKAGAVEIAKIGQYAENVYFGKGSGLMDQMVSSVGGFVFIDFLDTENPKIARHAFDFEHAGFSLCITDTKGSHSDLTDDYVAVPTEMKQVAQQFGQPYLRLVAEDAFYAAVPQLRQTCTDRAILRAAHFFGENRRAEQEAQALEQGDVEAFFRLVNASGDSSANLLQNLYSSKKPTQQEIPLALMMSRRLIGARGAVRVHGGGFAGTIQAFVPTEQTDAYVQEMNRIFGAGSCYVLRIRPVGGIELTVEDPA